MPIIYAPRGAAGEYSGLAATLYTGCGHRCNYCYVPRALRLEKADWWKMCAHPRPRTGVLEALAREAPRYTGDPREVLLSFSSDAYQPLEATEFVTRRAIGILADNDVKVSILTKGPGLAVHRDLDVLVRARASFGVTLVSISERFRASWEPGADSVAVRLAALRLARNAGLRTWVSLEPVIDAAEALEVLRECAAAGVGEVRVGKVNHNPTLEAAVDWSTFAADAVRLGKELGLRLVIKQSLRRWL